jgi:hypothetical protein
MTKRTRPRSFAPSSHHGANLELFDRVLAVSEENRDYLPPTCRQIYSLAAAYRFDPHHSARALTRMGAPAIYYGGVACVRDRREMTAKTFKQPEWGRR